MGCAVVKCLGSSEVIQYDIAMENGRRIDDNATDLLLTRAINGSSTSVHVEEDEAENRGLLLRGSLHEEEIEERGVSTGRDRETRRPFGCCSCCAERSQSGGGGHGQNLKQRHSISRLLMDGEEAHTTAALKLRLLLKQLEKGDVPSVSDMKKTISFAADVLSKLVPLGESKEREVEEERLELQKVKDQHVRAWISSTFTKDGSSYESRITPIERFRAVANTIIIGQFFGSLYKEAASFTQPKYPRGVQELFQKQLDNWDFDVFKVEALSNKQPLRFVGQELFSRHDLFRQCNISTQQLDCFLTKIEAGYGCHSNPYHNATHAADVASTIHYFIHSLGLKPYLTHLEVLAVLLSAIVHDVHHPGTTNSFQIAQKSEYAMMYNDRSVLENHHLYYSFMLIQDDECNILSGLTAEEYTQVRNMMIDMVLATDMSTHFDQIKQLKLILSGQDAASQLLGADRPKLYNFLVHMADISHPGKPWEQHSKWTDRLCEEFFLQGDEERKLGRQCSPLCDRYDTDIPESQHGFIQFIVGPSYDVCGDMLEIVLSSPLPSLPGNASPATAKRVQQPATTNGDFSDGGGEEGEEEEKAVESGDESSEICNGASRLIRVWADHLMQNRQKWKMESSKKGSEWLKKGVDQDLVPTAPFVIPAGKKNKEKKDLRIEVAKEQPLCNGSADLNEHCDHTDHVNQTDHVDQMNCTDVVRHHTDHDNSDPCNHADPSGNHSDPCNHTDPSDHNHVNGSAFEFHNTKNKLEETHTISTVQTVQIPGVSEVRTVQTVELRKITTNGTQQSANFENHNHEE